MIVNSFQEQNHWIVNENKVDYLMVLVLAILVKLLGSLLLNGPMVLALINRFYEIVNCIAWKYMYLC